MGMSGTGMKNKNDENNDSENSNSEDDENENGEIIEHENDEIIEHENERLSRTRIPEMLENERRDSREREARFSRTEMVRTKMAKMTRMTRIMRVKMTRIKMTRMKRMKLWRYLDVVGFGVESLHSDAGVLELARHLACGKHLDFDVENGAFSMSFHLDRQHVTELKGRLCHLGELTSVRSSPSGSSLLIFG